MSGIAFKTRTNGEVILSDWFNRLRAVLTGDIIPRNGSGAAEACAGSLGSATMKWLRACVAVGYWKAGDIKARQPYAGDAPVSQGWMLCNGRIVNEANYDGEHGAGSWARYVEFSPLEGRFLPNLVFPIGAIGNASDGSSPFESRADDQHTLSHNHEVYRHNISSGTSDQIFNSSGNPIDVVGIDGGGGIGLSASGQVADTSLYTAVTTPRIPTTPYGINTYFYMRII